MKTKQQNCSSSEAIIAFPLEGRVELIYFVSTEPIEQLRTSLSKSVALASGYGKRFLCYVKRPSLGGQYVLSLVGSSGRAGGRRSAGTLARTLSTTNSTRRSRQ